MSMPPPWWSLTDLACRPPDASRVVAQAASGPALTHADFVHQVDCWQAAFERQTARHWAIYLNDPFDFAAALLAAWHADKRVAVPGDDLPATVTALRVAGYSLAGDLPDALQAGGALDGANDEAHRPARKPLQMAFSALKVFTSGTQGQPEAIEKRLDQLVSEVQALETAFWSQLAPACGATAQPVVWATVSHQHIYGLLFLLLWPLSAGRPFGTRRLLYPEDLQARLGEKASVLVSTPAHLKRLGGQLDWQFARQQLQAVFSSGGPLPFDVSRAAAAALGKIPIEVFGSSETGGVAWRQCTVADEPWQAFSGVEWRLEESLLSVRSPHLFHTTWWTTSDRAAPAGDRTFRLLGRADRIVKIEEKRVSLSAIEQCLLGTPWLQDARALVVDTAIGARVGIVAVLNPTGIALQAQGRRSLIDSLRHAMAESVQAVAIPKRWRFVDALPTNAQGKSPESLLAALFLAPGEAVGETPMRPEMPAIEWLERDGTHAIAALDIQPALSVFDGHFEVAPILPGVAQLDWALTLGRQCFDLPQQFVRLEALKFVRTVTPGTRLLLDLKFRPALADVSLCSLTFRLYSQETSAPEATEHASGRAIWTYEKEIAHAA